MPVAGKLAVGLIGYGAIGQAVAAAIAAGQAGNSTLRVVLVRDVARYRDAADASVLTDDPDEFFAPALDIVIEAAGHESVRQYACRTLEKGADLLITSIGAFTDEAFFEELVARPSRFPLGGGHPPPTWWT